MPTAVEYGLSTGWHSSTAIEYGLTNSGQAKAGYTWSNGYTWSDGYTWSNALHTQATVDVSPGSPAPASESWPLIGVFAAVLLVLVAIAITVRRQVASR